MSTAQTWLLAYGAAITAIGYLLGAILGGIRMNQPSARNLATAHVETLMQAALGLGLAFAVGAVGFDSGAASVGAALFVVGLAMQAVGVTLNWLTDTGDQFAERSPGFFLNTASTFVALPGMAILVFGVLANL